MFFFLTKLSSPLLFLLLVLSISFFNITAFYLFSSPSSHISSLVSVRAIKASLITRFTPRLIHLPCFHFSTLSLLLSPAHGAHLLVTLSDTPSSYLVQSITLPWSLSVQLAFLIFIFCCLFTYHHRSAPPKPNFSPFLSPPTLLFFDSVLSPHGNGFAATGF